MTDPRDHAQRHDATEHTPDTGQPEDTTTGQRNSADELDADNAVEQDTIETLDPENPPA